MKKYIPQKIIQEIQSQIDPIQFLRHYTDIDGKGRGLCPFHSEKSPSFYVNEKGLWHCFGCQRGGNIFQFVMEKFEISFLDAVRLLGNEVGVYVDEVQVDIKKTKERQKINNEINKEEVWWKWIENEIHSTLCKRFRELGAESEWDCWTYEKERQLQEIFDLLDEAIELRKKSFTEKRRKLYG